MQGGGEVQKTTNAGVVAGSAVAADSAKSADVKFTTQNIGAWKSKQEDPFAKQNQEVAEKKAKRAEARKKLQPYVKWGAIGLGAAAVIAVVVVVLVNLLKQPEYNGPTISGDSSEDVIDFRGKLQEIYDETDDLDKVNEAVDELLGTSEGKKYKSQIKLAQAGFYWENGDLLAADEVLDDVDFDNLATQQQMQYYNIRALAAQFQGNSEKENEYNNLMYMLINENGGLGG